MFHELAHQVVYAEGDTPFNESFATAVERVAGPCGCRTMPAPQSAGIIRASQARRAQLVSSPRDGARLAEIYAQKSASDITSQGQLEAMKSEAMQDFRTRYAALRAQWLACATGRAHAGGLRPPGGPGEQRRLAAQAAYDGGADAFEALLRREGNDWATVL